MSHMRNFARNINSRDMVYLYDLEEASKEQGYKPKLLSVKDAAVQKGFYTDEYESKLADEYESPAVESIRKLIGGQVITPDERKHIAAYLMRFQLRSHGMRRHVQELYAQSAGEHIDSIKETYSTVHEALIDRGEQVDEELFAEIKGFEGSGDHYVELGGRNFAEGQVTTKQGDKRSTQLLSSLKWRIFTSDNQPFVLSDAFLVLEALDQPFYELYAPLGSNSCLFVSRYIHNLNDRWNIERIPISQANVRVINVRLAKQAEKYIVSGTDNLAWVKKAFETPDNAHRSIDVPELTNLNLLNEFITQRCPNCWHSFQDDEESQAFHTDVGEVTDGEVMISKLVQRKCSRCEFATDFSSPTDHKKYPIGPQAAQIRSILMPKPQ